MYSPRCLYSSTDAVNRYETYLHAPFMFTAVSSAVSNPPSVGAGSCTMLPNLANALAVTPSSG